MRKRLITLALAALIVISAAVMLWPQNKGLNGENTAAGRTDRFSTEHLSDQRSQDRHEDPAAVRSTDDEPPPLLDFASEIDERMEKAATDAAEAQKLFADLSRCVNAGNSDEPQAVQVVCLSSAAKLAKARPELADRYAELRGGASPKVTRLIQTMELLGDDDSD